MQGVSLKFEQLSAPRLALLCTAAVFALSGCGGGSIGKVSAASVTNSMEQRTQTIAGASAPATTEAVAANSATAATPATQTAAAATTPTATTTTTVAAASTTPVATGAASADKACAAVTAATCATARALGRGVNFGNSLEAPAEGVWGETFKPAHANVIKAAGFTHVRLPVRWTNHAAPTADATLDPAFASRVDTVIDQLLGAGLYVVVNLHHYRQLDGDALDNTEAGVAPGVVEARAVNVWRQVAARYAGKSDRLVFELYNEPHGTQDGAPWNALYPKLLAAVRESNPSRPVLIGPTWWNAASALSTFTTPTDRNVIVEVHAYEPHEFTHQGAWGSSHAAGSMTCCDTATQNKITAVLDTAKTWSLAKGYPIYIGEFGSHVSAPAASRATHARFMRTEMEKRGYSWAVWNFGSDFGIYDTAKNTWNEAMKAALTGP